MREFRPERILGVLERHGVDYVLIGGLAATAHGSPHVTTDVDVTPSRSLANLRRLSTALDELDARLRVVGEPEGISFRHDDRSLLGTNVLTMTTEFGELDVTFEPAGTRGYEDLAQSATTLTILGVHVPVASLEDVVRSKEAAGREKDLVTLPTLRRLLAEESGRGTLGQRRRPDG